MKKTFTILLTFALFLTLLGCEDTKDKYVPTSDFTIVTCADDCLYDDGTEAIKWMSNIYEDKSLYKYDIPSGFEYSFLGGTGNTFLRTDLNTEHTIGGKYREDYIDVYDGFNAPIGFMSIYWDLCTGVDTCQGGLLGEDVIKNLEYGFTETSGYLNFELYDKNDNILKKTQMSYAVVDDDLEYQYYNMDYRSDAPTYIEYRNSIYRKYFTLHNGTKQYTYIDTLTEEYVSQLFWDDDTCFYYYEKEKGVGYQYRWPYSDVEYNVFLARDTIDMFAIAYDNEKYYVDINFHNMDGWDTIEDYLQPAIAPNDERYIWGQYKLFNNSVRVYEDYTLLGYFMNEYYDVVSGSKELLYDEIATYSLPDDFRFDVEERVVTEAFLDFAALENKTEILPYQQEDILSFFEEIGTLYE